jgi:hypothetical protein
LINPHDSHSAIGNISLPNFWPDKNKSTNLRLMQYAADVRFFLILNGRRHDVAAALVPVNLNWLSKKSVQNENPA